MKFIKYLLLIGTLSHVAYADEVDNKKKKKKHISDSDPVAVLYMGIIPSICIIFSTLWTRCSFKELNSKLDLIALKRTLKTNSGNSSPGSSRKSSGTETPNTNNNNTNGNAGASNGSK